jgi:hypothetical protein
MVEKPLSKEGNNRISRWREILTRSRLMSPKVIREIVKYLGSFIILGSSIIRAEPAPDFLSSREGAREPTKMEEKVTWNPKKMIKMISEKYPEFLLPSAEEKGGPNTYVDICYEIYKKQKESCNLTFEFNEIEAIREFLKPGSPIGISEFWALTLDLPVRTEFLSNIKDFIRVRYLALFRDAAGMRWFSDLETLRSGLKGDRYEIKSLVVKAGVPEEVERFLPPIFVRPVMVTDKIQLYNHNNGQYLDLLGFGTARPPLPFIPFDKERAIKEAINDAFTNLWYLLQVALSEEKVQIGMLQRGVTPFMISQ